MIVLAIYNDDMSKGNTASHIHSACQYLYFLQLQEAVRVPTSKILTLLLARPGRARLTIHY